MNGVGERDQKASEVNKGRSESNQKDYIIYMYEFVKDKYFKVRYYLGSCFHKF